MLEAVFLLIFFSPVLIALVALFSTFSHADSQRQKSRVHALLGISILLLICVSGLALLAFGLGCGASCSSNPIPMLVSLEIGVSTALYFFAYRRIKHLSQTEEEQDVHNPSRPEG